MNTDEHYRETWQSLVKKEERLPDWIMNLDGTASPMQAKEDDGDKYLVGGLCKDTDCKHDRLFVAFSWDKSEAYGLYVQVPEALPADKSPSKHATFRWLGKPDAGQKQLLDEQLKSDPNWY
ncbi:MAG: Inhibitor of vertebrate lysozyme [Pseudomonas citronellolis]|nr:MAG: Inhibitor of vertebrate lysozyme [Pseudomonas citronellolis]